MSCSSAIRELPNPFVTRTRPNTEDDTRATATTTTTWGVSYDTRKLHELISHRCPSYEIIVSNLRGQMRLYVLALKSVAGEITNVRVAGENTGLGSVLANKVTFTECVRLGAMRASFFTS